MSKQDKLILKKIIKILLLPPLKIKIVEQELFMVVKSDKLFAPQLMWSPNLTIDNATVVNGKEVLGMYKSVAVNVVPVLYDHTIIGAKLSPDPSSEEKV